MAGSNHMRYGWREYVPVHMRRANGLKQAQELVGKGKSLKPCRVEGREIAKTFWGRSWCKHLENFSDFANRLPRGRTYARNGSVIHLDITSGRIDAMVSGSDLYQIEITIDKLTTKAWKQLCGECTGSVTSMIDLLQGRMPEEIITTLTNPQTGLFPRSNQIHMNCDCPDWASLCKHLAAVLYAIGNRLDHSPELLFLLRGVDQNDLITTSLVETIDATAGIEGATVLDSAQLEDIFGIDLQTDPGVSTPGTPDKKRSGKKRATRNSASKKKPKSRQRSRTGKDKKQTKKKARSPATNKRTDKKS